MVGRKEPEMLVCTQEQRERVEDFIWEMVVPEVPDDPDAEADLSVLEPCDVPDFQPSSSCTICLRPLKRPGHFCSKRCLFIWASRLKLIRIYVLTCGVLPTIEE